MTKRITLVAAYLLSVLYAFAQGPGGVTGAELWHIATATTNNTDSSYVWRDYSGDSTRFMSIENDYLIVRPQSEMQSFNFHPALHFDSISGKSLLQHTNLAQTTLIGVFAPDSVRIRQGNENPVEFYRAYGRLVENISMFTDSVYDLSRGNLSHKYIEDNYASFNETALRTITYQRANVPNHSVWGEPDSSSLLLNTDGRLFTGYSPELIVYGRMLSQLERRKVETYLAMKYGITLWGSYISPDNHLIWNSNDSAFHHRVTAIAKYSGSSLSQMLSTTSYEELPRNTVFSSNDAFYKRSTFNKPTPHRLLTLGHEYGYSLPNNTYMIWGDDGDALSLETQSESLWHVMDRKWKLNSNMPSGATSATTVASTNIDVTTYRDGLYAIHRADSSATVSSVAFSPRTTNDLHYSFVCPKSFPAFEITVRRTANLNRNSYGYRFESDGSVRKIIANALSSTTVYNNAKGHRIDIYKKGQNLYLQIDGEGSFDNIIALPNSSVPRPFGMDTLIVIDPGSPFNPNDGGTGTNAVNDDTDDPERIIPGGGGLILLNDYSGFVKVDPGAPFDLNSFRVNGFNNTGNQLELSYNIANGLKPYRKNRSILLVNESTDFSDPDDVDQRIACTDFDIYRQKLMFHNVYFKKDSTSYFTFGAYDGLLAEFTPIKATCGIHGSDNNGKLKIDISCGSPLYKCTMIPVLHAHNLQAYMDSLSQNNQIVPDYLSGITFGTDHYTVRYLRPGEYGLTLKQLGGDNIYASESPRAQRSYLASLCGSAPRTGKWFITDTLSDYKAGLVPTGNLNNNIAIGFEIKGKKCYYLIGNSRQLISNNIKPGDSLMVSVNMRQVSLAYNDVTIDSVLTTAVEIGKFKAEFDRGGATLANVTIGNYQSIPDGTVTDESVLVEHVIPYTIHKTVFIGSECDDNLPNEVVDPIAYAPQQTPQRQYVDNSGIDELISNNGALKVSAQGSQNFTAELTTSDSGIAQLLVFDTMGRMIAEGTMSGSSVKTASFSVPAFGVYIVKVLTDHEEYSEKILCK